MSGQSEMSIEPMAPLVGCSAGAERMRAHRQRRHAGLRCVTIELRETEVTELIRRKLLDTDARHDLHAIRGAIHHHLDVTLAARV
jgi:hypothetical protein